MISPIRQRLQQRAVGFIVIFVVGAILSIIFRSSLMVAISYVQAPLVSAGTWVNKNTIGFFEQSKFSEERVRELEEQRNSLANDKVDSERLLSENKQLKAELNFISRKEIGHVTVSIISRSISNRSSTFLINGGSDDGIKVGYPVIVGDGIFVGKVTSTTSVTSTVTSITDPAIATAVTLINETNTLGIIKGMTGMLLELNFIPQDEKLEINDLVISSGLEEEIPSGLLVGIVNDVKKESTDPFQSAVVESLVDIRQFHIVSVILSSQ